MDSKWSGEPANDVRQTYTVTEAAQVLGAGKDAVNEAVRRGEIPAVRIDRRVVGGPATAQLLRKVSDTRLYIPVLLAVTTRMRRGEILALTWKDVDLKVVDSP